MLKLHETERAREIIGRLTGREVSGSEAVETSLLDALEAIANRLDRLEAEQRISTDA